VNLFYVSPSNLKGGWSTYTAHLARSFGNGAALYLVRPQSKTDGRPTKFFGVAASVVSLDHAVQIISENPTWSLITAVHARMWPRVLNLIRAGAALVIHDPEELKSSRTARTIVEKYISRVIGIRKAMKRILPASTIVPHPYVPFNKRVSDLRTRPHLAVSTARVDSDKRTYILLDANRLLPDAARIHIRGFDQRLWSKRVLIPKYPEYQQSSGNFPPRLEEGVKICSSYKISVDMSKIRDDGGGTQYTFLEAMDAGCILVIHRDWILPDDEMIPGVNCIVVGNAVELAKLLKHCYEDPDYANSLRSQLLDGYQRTLGSHSPQEVVPKYLRALEESQRRAKVRMIW